MLFLQQNKNLGGDNVNQNGCGGDQVIRDSNNAASQGGLLSGLGLRRRQDNENLGGDGVNQNCAGDQVVRDSNNESEDNGLVGGLLGGLGLSKRAKGGYYYFPTINDNQNLGGDNANQNVGGSQVVRDSNNNAEQGGLLDGLLKRSGSGYYYYPTVNQNDNLGGDGVNQNVGGDQVVRDSNNDAKQGGLLSGLGLAKRTQGGYYYFPTADTNKNLGGDQNNQNAGGAQVVRESNNDVTDDGLLGGLGL